MFIKQIHFLYENKSFTDKYGISGVIGIKDCTHVAIVSPKVEGLYPEHNLYINRKNYHPVNVQLVMLYLRGYVLNTKFF